MARTPTRRFADADTARAYPLAVSGPVRWLWRDGAWRLSLPLDDLTAGTILAPSLALGPPGDLAEAQPAARYRWTLRAADGSWPLQEIPCAGPVAGVPSGGAVSTHIDCFHIHRRLPAPVLHLAVRAPSPPERYLICVSSRALTLARPPLPPRAAAVATPPPTRSQLDAPAEIAQRICSPTCVSMVLGLWHRPHDWLALTEECRDPATGTYGIWPLAVAAAARRGCIGAVELFDDWREPLAVLERGIPLIASIRFEPDELPGAPLPRSNGHLVAVYGADPERIRVCDPAAGADEVRRSYPADAFSGAWLRHRGAAYILPP
jgi:hypothetical protein